MPATPSRQLVPSGTVAERVALFTPKKDRPVSHASHGSHLRTPTRIEAWTADRDQHPDQGARVGFGKRREGSFGSPATRGLRYAEEGSDYSGTASRTDLVRKTKFGHVLRRTGHVGGQSSAPFEDVAVYQEESLLKSSSMIPRQEVAASFESLDLPSAVDLRQESSEHVNEASSHECLQHGYGSRLDDQRKETKGDEATSSHRQTEKGWRSQLDDGHSQVQDPPDARTSPQSKKTGAPESHSISPPIPKMQETDEKASDFERFQRISRSRLSKIEESRRARMSRRSLQDIRDDAQSVIESSASGRSIRKQLERETHERFMAQKSTFTSPVRTQNESASPIRMHDHSKSPIQMRNDSDSEMLSDKIRTIYCSGNISSGESSSESESSAERGRSHSKASRRKPKLQHCQPVASHKRPKFLDNGDLSSDDTSNKSQRVCTKPISARTSGSLPSSKGHGQLKVSKQRLDKRQDSLAPSSRPRNFDIDQPSTPATPSRAGSDDKQSLQASSRLDKTDPRMTKTTQSELAERDTNEVSKSSSSFSTPAHHPTQKPGSKDPNGPSSSDMTAERGAAPVNVTRKSSFGSFLTSVNAPIRQWSFSQKMAAWRSQKKEHANAHANANINVDRDTDARAGAKSSAGTNLNPTILQEGEDVFAVSPITKSSLRSSDNETKTAGQDDDEEASEASSSGSTVKDFSSRSSGAIAKTCFKQLRRVTSIPERRLGQSKVPRRAQSFCVNEQKSRARGSHLEAVLENQSASRTVRDASHGIIGVKVIVIFKGGREVEVQTSISGQKLRKVEDAIDVASARSSFS